MKSSSPKLTKSQSVKRKTLSIHSNLNDDDIRHNRITSYTKQICEVSFRSNGNNNKVTDGNFSIFLLI